jgi:hypothetical protein
MSTNDVPGAKAANNDQLAMGCWAEHEDGSLVFVASTENDEVVYSMFDLSKSPAQEFRDKMPLKGFESYFTYNGKNTKWTWHDKTPFPWDKIIKHGITDGVLPSSNIHDQVAGAHSVAKMLADKLGIKPKTVDADQLSALIPVEKKVVDIIQDSIGSCPVGKASKKLTKLIKKKDKIERKIAKLVV